MAATTTTAERNDTNMVFVSKNGGQTPQVSKQQQQAPLDPSNIDVSQYPPSGVACLNDCVLLLDGSHRFTSIRLRKEKDLHCKILKISNVNVDEIIGSPYGSVFEIGVDKSIEAQKKSIPKLMKSKKPWKQHKYSSNKYKLFRCYSKNDSKTNSNDNCNDRRNEKEILFRFHGDSTNIDESYTETKDNSNIIDITSRLTTVRPNQQTKVSASQNENTNNNNSNNEKKKCENEQTQNADSNNNGNQSNDNENNEKIENNKEDTEMQTCRKAKTKTKTKEKQVDAQKLTQEDILSMRDTVVTSKSNINRSDNDNKGDNSNNNNNNNNNKHATALIDALAANNESFSSKTVFAQEKYINKKKKKHLTMKFILYECNALNITQFYFIKNRTKTLGMRVDTMSQILTLSNVHSGQQIVCVESLTGLLVGALASKMGGYGRILNGYSTLHPNVTIANEMYNMTYVV